MTTKTDAERAKTPAMIGRCKVCDGVVYATVDDEDTDRAEMAKTIAKLVRKGHHVSRVTVADVRASTWCDC